jgi:hypothetical protein
VKNEISSFVERFFLDTGAIVDYEGTLMKVENVPKEIQNLIGKGEPYFFSTEATERNNVEVLTNGSFILKIINDFLSNKGQTTILKIDFSKRISHIK